MPDNVAITPGTGASVATDQIGTAHYQRVKITDGTPDSENHLVVDASGNAMVKIAAGTAAIGKLAANTGVDIGDVDVTSCALPTGAATEAKQTTGNSSLSSIDGKIPALGQALAAASVPVILPAATVTTLTPPAAITNFANETGGNLAAIKAGVDKIPAQGQALAAASMPVVLPAAQVTTLTPPAAITGFATETTLGTVHGHVDSIDGKITACNTGAVVLAAGTAAIGKLAANSGVDIGDVDVASIAAGTNAIGKLLPPDVDVTAHTNYARKYYTSAGAATDGIIWSPAAGKRWHVTSLIFQVSADATVTFEDDKSGGDDPVLKGEFKAGSGLALTFDEKYPFASGEDAADLTVTTSAGNIYISVVGFEI